MSWKGIVGARFSPNEFTNYIGHLTFSAWRPQFVVVHNTSSPTLAQRPNGFTDAHIQNLVAFYRDQQHWSAGPHCFIDQNGIWVFTPLTVPGVHSPSWNSISWGIETLGEYMSDRFTDPIHANLVGCLATLHMAAGLDLASLRFHKEDPRTTHRDCPGINMNKGKLTNDVHDLIVSRAPGEHTDISKSGESA
jgi:N-acetylmuramoyl-L-alanine amidase